METSASARLLILFIIFAGSFIITAQNIRLLYRIIARKPVSARARIVWHGLGVLMLFAAADAFLIEPNWVELTHTTIETKKLPSSERIRIVHLSDIHTEDFGKRERKMLDLTKRARPDIIVLTGDYRHLSNPSTRRELTIIGKRLSQIAPTYAIPGNVDGVEDRLALEAGGVMWLNGWVTAHVKDMKIAIGHLELLPTELPPIPDDALDLYKVLLCHWPYFFDEIAKRGIDLTLTGHTHGGQVRLPIFGALLPNIHAVGKYQAGLYHKHNSTLYISRGIGLEGGIAPRVRFFCRPEVAVIDIEGSK